MLKQLLKFGWVIALLITLVSCEKTMIPPPQINWYDYIGKWENINAFSDNIDQIIITRRKPGQLSVQLWGSCGTEVCERGLFSYSESDLDETTLPMPLTWNKQELPLSLSITTDGKLELKALEDHSGDFETQYFSWVQAASFYEQVTQVDARSLLLTAIQINGSPGDPDNRLISKNILIFQTNEGRLGKIQVHGNDFFLSLRWQTWSPDGTIYYSTDYFPVYKSGYYDLDHGEIDETSDYRYSDFYWSLENQTIRWLEPVNGAGFALYHLE